MINFPLSIIKLNPRIFWDRDQFCPVIPECGYAFKILNPSLSKWLSSSVAYLSQWPSFSTTHPPTTAPMTFFVSFFTTKCPSFSTTRSWRRLVLRRFLPLFTLSAEKEKFSNLNYITAIQILYTIKHQIIFISNLVSSSVA